MSNLNENSLAEQPTMEWLKRLGYDVAYGPDLALGAAFQERVDEKMRDVILRPRLLRSLRRLNPQLSDGALEEVVREFTRAAEGPQLIFANKKIYEYITRGVSVAVRDAEGKEQIVLARVIDFEHPLNNEFLAVNQFAIAGAERARRPDVIMFVNGLPLAVFELKSPIKKTATADAAINQLDDYKKDIPVLFAYNQVLVVGDMLSAFHGTISSTPEWFAEWKYIEDEGEDRKADLETLITGMFDKRRFLDIVQNFIVFEADSEKDAATYTKKMCKYHQYYGVKRAVERTMKATRAGGDRKIGVFWHTQGSGKTLSMVFYVNKLRHIAELRSPTVIFLTDRNDLDDQIFKTFKHTGYSAIAHRMESIQELKEKLRTPGAELVFTTIQKFATEQEMLSENDNIIIIADEAHRSQYKDFGGNIRAALPHASFMGITGTPISFASRDTRLVFGDIISEYRIDQSVHDKATVTLYYESHLVPLNLKNPGVDEDFEALLQGRLSKEEAEKLKRKFARLEGAVGAPDRLDHIAEHIVDHFNNRGLEGKAMVVAINRQVAVEIYKRISARPDAPRAAVVVSGLDEFRAEVQKELSVKELEKQFKDPNDALKIAIVCDMWLTGFDVPVVHTMYLDKPLKGHTLMQAIARANRVYKDKPAGLIVDYIGIASELKKALSRYSSGIKTGGILPLEEAIAMMNAKFAAVSYFFGGITWKGWRKLHAVALADLFCAAVAGVIGEDDRIDEERKRRFIAETAALEKLHALIMPHAQANAIRDDVMFFQAVKAAVYKRIVVEPMPGMNMVTKGMQSAIKQLIAESISAEGAIDLFAAEGKAKPEISIFDERFLEEVKKLRFKNLAVETMRKLLQDELEMRQRTNKARFESLWQILQELIEKYENNIISSAEVIEQLINLAHEIRAQEMAGAKLGLSSDELAFYDALMAGKKGIKGDERLKGLVHELVKMIRRDAGVDWMNNEVIKARIRTNVRLMLLRNGFSAQDLPVLVDMIFNQASMLYADVIS